jgi:hypothetical protein
MSDGHGPDGRSEGAGMQAAPRSARRADPLGKRALFSDPEAGPQPGPGPGPAPDGSGSGSGLGTVPSRPGRRDLFSGPGLGARSVVVECQRCRARTPIGVTGLIRRLIPSLWFPPTRFSRYLRCPACNRFGWCRVDWSVFRPR